MKYHFEPRQLECIRLMAQGLQNDEIAYRMGISPNTVKAQLHRAFKITGCSNRTQLARIYFELEKENGPPLDSEVPPVHPLDRRGIHHPPR